MGSKRRRTQKERRDMKKEIRCSKHEEKGQKLMDTSNYSTF
jgi:hypothetical protein